MIAQAYALRAYCYLQLIKRWGGVPVLRESLGKDHDYSKDKRASFAQCVDFIIESCDKALAADEAPQRRQRLLSYGLPELSRAAIWTVKSQAALYAASPLWADDCAGTEIHLGTRRRNHQAGARPLHRSRPLRLMPPRPFRTSPRPA